MSNAVKETWVEVKESDTHDNDCVLFGIAQSGFILPPDRKGLDRAKAALERALAEIARFEAVLTS